MYEGIALTEHFWFKRGFSGYDITIWKNPSLLPLGVAAVTAFLFGALGAAMGMAQVWYVSPIGKLIGNPMYGGDIGFELAFSFSAIAYFGLRTVEKHFMKR